MSGKIAKSYIGGLRGFVNYMLMMMSKGMSGDMQFVITPATTTRAATSAAWTRVVKIELKAANGLVHKWFNGSLAVSIADTSSAGTASIVTTTPTMTEGVCEVVISGSAAAWLADETNTLTLSSKTIAGVSVAGGTSVETITA